MQIGQWLGSYYGNEPGYLILNLELINHEYKGQIILSSKNAHSFMAYVCFDINNENIAYLSEFYPIDPQSGLPALTEESKKSLERSLSNIKIPINGILDISNTNETKDKIKGNIKTCVLKKTEFELTLHKTGTKNFYKPLIKTWEQYKSYIKDLNQNHYIYRGQSTTMPLRTSFHRHNRCNLIRYSMVDIPLLRKHICAETGRLFNLRDMDEHGAFLNLAQHNGYPTPLLDWTSSPYIAAYFAFAEISNLCVSSNVRIFVFDGFNWSSDCPTTGDIATTKLSIRVLDLLAINNNRAIPQQSVTTFSNVDDIEAYIHSQEIKNEKNYLTIIELPVTEKDNVLKDLYQMGVTASSLFPGLTGVCKMLKEKYF